MSVEVLTTISPTTNEPILTRNGISQADLDELPNTATKAFESWSKTSLADRQKIVKTALKLLLNLKDDLAQELTVQMGRPIAYTGVEVATAVKRAEYLLKISDEVLKDTDGEAEKGFKRFIRKVPVGPVLVIFAWNYPYLILVNSLIPALLAGNTVILKPSPQTPTIVERVAKVFEEAGLPSGVLQHFHCGSPTLIESIVRNPQIKLVAFTGSVAGGLAVQQAAADRVVNVGLELGGKDPAYIRGDVDIDWAAAEIVDGAVFNSGQSCCSVERVYVADEIHDAFVEAVQKVLKGYVLGDPFDKGTHVGPVISKRSKETIEAHVQDAVAKGAKDATPENESFANPPPKGNFVKPTLLTGVDHSMTVMTEETFGPVIPVMRVKNDDEAVKLMNDSEFGLTASIWTKDTDRGYELADQVEAGTVFVNRCDFPSPDLAWTGWKNSGKGQTLSRFGYDQFVKLKSYHLKDYPK
ncbi:Succinate-semialdehyde dehydrogenase [NADP(+)] [Colletotrichum gloeosporioides]|uniref:aldehyde dehydrogenase (NAD(+)) n=2 Tax=Colletotrichum gloeosporioides TaxID=474922 RepID=T0KAW3_COLGC|nr:Succinate-semialdehyde dehydrogenase [NADP(+)] [Colletotrichum gloeosporioides]EQB52467.1 aldehyde dehydrogenase [Colletotrichum gloeosporioides Cg-14]KAF3803271.1 Succinate-semialdehyde dehydrogenase [NADP(+)] [Colletotrichum gloeosporioides]